MKHIPVKFKSMRDGKNISQIASKFDYPVYLICGRYKVNAKSILGIFSLPNFDDVKIQVDTDDTEKIIEELRKYELLDEKK